jgi:hypothetical protein
MFRQSGSSWKVFLSLLVAGVGTLISAQVYAAILPQEIQYPNPETEYHTPTPLSVPGKEYSTDQDTNAVGELVPGQTVMWKGDGTVKDGINYKYNYSGGLPGGFQIDEIANCRDKYMLDLIGDRVSLVFSLENNANIFYHKSSVLDKSAGIWATPSQINYAAIPADIDGLELWGPDDKADANMYSREGDPGGTAVFKYNEDTTQSSTYLTTAVLFDHLVMNDGVTLAKYSGLTEAQIDLDGLVVWDSFDDGVFGPQDIVMFSIKPVESGLFDGGEIWTYTYGDATAKFLNQGGVIWNTSHDVRVELGLGTTVSENIDALEALPEPTTLGLLILGGLGLLRRKR